MILLKLVEGDIAVDDTFNCTVGRCCWRGVVVIEVLGCISYIVEVNWCSNNIQCIQLIVVRHKEFFVDKSKFYLEIFSFKKLGHDKIC